MDVDNNLVDVVKDELGLELEDGEEVVDGETDDEDEDFVLDDEELRPEDAEDELVGAAEELLAMALDSGDRDDSREELDVERKFENLRFGLT